MSLNQTTCSSHIGLHAGKQGEHSTEVGALAAVFKKLATELKSNPKLLRCKNTVRIVTLNMRTLNRISQLLELIAFSVEHNII